MGVCSVGVQVFGLGFKWNVNSPHLVPIYKPRGSVRSNLFKSQKPFHLPSHYSKGKHLWITGHVCTLQYLMNALIQ